VIIIPSNVGRKGPVQYIGVGGQHNGTSFTAISTTAAVGDTILYAMGSYQNNTTISVTYGSQSMTSSGTATAYGAYSMNYLLKASVANQSVTPSGTAGSGYGHAAAWFRNVESITALTTVNPATSQTYTASCAEGEMLVALTGIAVGIGQHSGGTAVIRVGYPEGGYGGAGIRYAAGPTTTTFVTDTSWGIGVQVILLKP